MGKSPKRPLNRLERLRDPDAAMRHLSEGLNQAGDACDDRIAARALRDIVMVSGGVAVVAHKSGLPYRAVYRTVTGKRALYFRTLDRLLPALGYRFTVKLVADR